MDKRLRIIAFILFFSSNTLFQSGLDAFVTSVKASGMALTGVAYPQDAHAAVFNPAGATRIGDRLDGDLTWNHYTGKSIFRHNRSLVIPGINGTFNAVQQKNSYAPSLGINKNLCLWNIPISVGLVMFTRDFGKTTYTRPLPLIGTSPPGLELTRPQASLYTAIEFDPSAYFNCDNFWIGRQSIGVSVDFIGQRFKADGFQNAISISISPKHVTNHGYDYKYGVGATIGWMGDFFSDYLTLGVAIKPKITCGRFKKYEGFLADRGRLDVPTTLLAGFAIHWLPGKSTIAFDLEYGWLSKIKALANPSIVPNSLDTLFGTSHGPGYGWKNQAIYRIGIDYKLSCSLTIRAGYSWRTELFSHLENFANALSMEIMRDYITVGGSWKYNCFEASMFYAYGIQILKKGKDTIPAAQPFGGGDVDLKLIRNLVGLSLGYNY